MDFQLVCNEAAAAMVSFIRELVEAESPSTDPVALEACARVLVQRMTAAGATVRRVEADGTASHVIATWPGDGPRVLLVGHFDTVWPVGQIARMPIREDEGRLHGPGVFDMKAGLALGLEAARVVNAHLEPALRPQVTMIATSDEEVGSRTSRATIEALARESTAVLVLEPALPGGALKTARKGVGEFRIDVHGIASHAGANPGAGASAVHELARQITRIEALNDAARGVSVNVGIIAGGTRSNVVAEQASAQIDVRVARLADADAVAAAFAALAPVDPRVRLTVDGGINRPPMERIDAVARLFALAQDVARGVGRELQEGGTGGASDGNFTAALGVPTLDGLGATGDGPHAIHEHVIVKDLPWRAALLAGLVARLGQMR